jgi:hypothetical protein
MNSAEVFIKMIDYYWRRSPCRSASAIHILLTTETENEIMVVAKINLGTKGQQSLCQSDYAPFTIGIKSC